MAMWAGVQKESRPMERCQETSHAPPIEADVTASAPHQAYQGTVAACVVTCPTGRAGGGFAEAADVAIKPHRLWRYLTTSLIFHWQDVARLLLRGSEFLADASSMRARVCVGLEGVLSYCVRGFYPECYWLPHGELRW